MAYYPHVQGDESLREFTANKIASDRGIKTDKDSIVLCNGSGEANGLIIQALIDPGDYVIAEQFVYMGTTKQLTFYNANTVGSPIDDKGLIPEKLEETILKIKMIMVLCQKCFIQYLNIKIQLAQHCQKIVD